MPPSLEDMKAEARKVASRLRSRVHAAAATQAPAQLAAMSLPVRAEPGASVVSGYFPYRSEIDVRQLLGRLAGEGWTTCLPVVVALGQALQFRRWLPGEPTVPGMWGISCPVPEAPLLEPDVLLVPMLAFDRKGYRLGYGGGFYDRTLRDLRRAKKIVAIGIAYADQEVAAVPHDENDQVLDFIMTEQEVFACGSCSSAM